MRMVRKRQIPAGLATEPPTHVGTAGQFLRRLFGVFSKNTPDGASIRGLSVHPGFAFQLISSGPG